MDSDKAILSFFDSLKPLTEVDENLQEYLEKEEKRFKKVQDERKKERRLQKKEAQLAKRKKADKGNILTKLFGTKEERKKRAGEINKWLIAGLGLAGAGFTAAMVAKYHKEIGEALAPVVEEIGTKVKEMAGDAANKMIESLKETASKAALSLGDSIKSGISGLLGIEDTKNKMAGGEGFRQAREANTQKLADAGLNQQGRTMGRGAQRPEITAEQQEVADDAAKETARLDKLRKEMEKELAELRNSRGRIKDKKREAEIRKEYNDKALRRQVGGPINVPGSGSGDKVPMMLPAGSFVLNREASKVFQGFQTGGEVKEATNVLKLDEALSSLTKGTNDYVKPGGRSVRSGTPWESITPNTPIHAYRDSVGVPTIGWGSTYYDNIMAGKKPVRMGDTITKQKADDVLSKNVGALAKTYSEKMKYWKRMSTQQKAGLLSLGYNAPNAPIGSYRNLTAALNRGDMVGAANNIKRRGPSAHRLKEEKRLILSGPKDLTTVTAPTPVKAPPPVDNKGLMDRIGSMFSNMFRRPEKRQMGGVVGGGQQRFQQAQENFLDTVGNKTKQHVVVIKRRPAIQTPQAPQHPQNIGSGGGVNTFEISDQLHRIQSGAAM